MFVSGIPFRSTIDLNLCPETRSTQRGGFSVVELIVILAIAAFMVCCILIVLPRGRETARMSGCQQNMMQIGFAVLLYEQSNRRYPASALGSQGPTGKSPIQTMLDALLIPDFLDLHDSAQQPTPTRSAVARSRVPGLVCPSDPAFGSEMISGAISYRANAGDETSGTNGPFAPGSAVSLKGVEAADGASFTAGYAERLIGTGEDDVAVLANYREEPGQITSTPLASTSTGRWRGDAGSSWSDPSWRSAIYNHTLLPDASPSRVAMDRRTAAIGASSIHPGRVNVWMLDGSLRGTTPSIAPSVWKALGSYHQPPRSQ